MTHRSPPPNDPRSKGPLEPEASPQGLPASPRTGPSPSDARLDELLATDQLLPVSLGLLARVRDAVLADPALQCRAPRVAALTPPGAAAVAARPEPLRWGVVRAAAAALLVAVGAGMTWLGIAPVAAASETLREAGVHTGLDLPTSLPLGPDLLPGIASSAHPGPEGAAATPAPAPENWLRAPSVAALAAVPDSVPGGPAALAGAAILFLGAGLGLAWRARGRAAHAATSDPAAFDPAIGAPTSTGDPR